MLRFGCHDEVQLYKFTYGDKAAPIAKPNLVHIAWGTTLKLTSNLNIYNSYCNLIEISCLAHLVYE
jgi:hypothetical protein